MSGSLDFLELFFNMNLNCLHVYPHIGTTHTLHTTKTIYIGSLCTAGKGLNPSHLLGKEN